MYNIHSWWTHTDSKQMASPASCESDTAALVLFYWAVITVWEREDSDVVSLIQFNQQVSVLPLRFSHFPQIQEKTLLLQASGASFESITKLKWHLAVS